MDVIRLYPLLLQDRPLSHLITEQPYFIKIFTRNLTKKGISSRQ